VVTLEILKETTLTFLYISWLIKSVTAYTIRVHQARLGFRASLAKARPSAIRLAESGLKPLYYVYVEPVPLSKAKP
jgi:hypothetical protein